MLGLMPRAATTPTAAGGVTEALGDVEDGEGDEDPGGEFADPLGLLSTCRAAGAFLRKLDMRSIRYCDFHLFQAKLDELRGYEWLFVHAQSTFLCRRNSCPQNWSSG